MNQNWLNIPVSICIYALKYKCINQLQLFCWLKLNCNHRFCCNNQLIFSAMKELRINKQTFYRRLSWLIKKKWIGVNSIKKIYHLNSFRIIHNKTNLPIRKSVIWQTEMSFSEFRAFICGSIICYFVKRKNFTDKYDIVKIDKDFNRVRMKKKRPMMNSGLNYYNLPLEYLSKQLNLPKSTIQGMIALAQKHSFIEVQEKFQETNISVKRLNQLRRFDKNNDSLRKLVYKDGKVFEQLPNSITPLIRLTNSSNLKQKKLENKYRM